MFVSQTTPPPALIGWLLLVVLVLDPPIFVNGQKSATSVDVNFVLEDVTATGASNFELEKNFVVDFVDAVVIGASNVQVSVSRLNSDMHNDIELNENSDSTALKNAISALTSSPQTSLNIYDAFDDLADEAYFVDTARGWRHDADQYMVVVLSQDSSTGVFETAQDAANVRNYFKVIIIGVGSAFVERDLKRYASNPLLYFHVERFEDLDTLIPTLSMIGYLDVPKVDTFTANGGSTNFTVSAGSIVKFYCKGVGNPFPTMYIFSQFGEGAVNSDPPAFSDFVNAVEGAKVMAVGQSDVFYCKAINDRGEDERVIQVTVSGPPTLPEITTSDLLTVVAMDGGISISFPVHTYQNPTGYTLARITPIPGSTPRSTTIPSQDYTVTFTRKDIRHGIVELSFTQASYEAVNQFSLTVTNDEGDLSIPFTATYTETTTTTTTTAAPLKDDDGMDSEVKVGLIVGGALVGMVLILVVGLVVYLLKELTSVKKQLTFTKAARPYHANMSPPKAPTGLYHSSFGPRAVY